jgi:hypothetical protein
MKRITVTDVLRDDHGSLYDLDGLTMDQVIAWAEKIRDEWSSKGYSDIRIALEGYGYDGGVELHIKGDREETDTEYEKRIENIRKEREKQKAIKEAKRTAEYEEYLKLKAKFE